MPRNMQHGLQEFLQRKNKQCITRSTLVINVDKATPPRLYHFATAALNLNNVDYLPLMRGTTQIRGSITRASNQTTCSLHNSDTLAGLDFLSLGSPLFNAGIEIGRYWKDLENEAEYTHIFLVGVLTDVQVDQNEVRLTAITEPYANIPAGAVRRVTPDCGWIYKDPATCGSTSLLPDCNFLLTHSDGCINRHSGTDNRGRFGGFAYLNSQNRLLNT